MNGHAFFTTELDQLIGRVFTVPAHVELPAHHGLSESERKKLLVRDDEIRIAESQRIASTREYWLEKNRKFKSMGESRKNGKR